MSLQRLMPKFVCDACENEAFLGESSVDCGNWPEGWANVKKLKEYDKHYCPECVQFMVDRMAAQKQVN